MCTVHCESPLACARTWLRTWHAVHNIDARIFNDMSTTRLTVKSLYVYALMAVEVKHAENG